MARDPPRTSVKDAVHKIQSSLIDFSSHAESKLLAAGSLLSRPDYEDVVVERSISGLCGYPVCGRSLPSDRPRKGRYRISLSEHRVYDLQETYKYCSSGCLVSSRAFSSSLEDGRPVDAAVDPAKIDRVMRMFEGLSLDGRDGDLGMSKVKITEKSDRTVGEAPFEEWVGPPNAIEGYVPLRDHGGSSSSIGHEAGPDSKESTRKTEVNLILDEINFTSTIIFGDELSVPPKKPSSSTQKASNELKVKKVEGKDETKKKKPKSYGDPPKSLQESSDAVGGKSEPDKSTLKSSLKTSGTKDPKRSVKWADENKTKNLVERESAYEDVESSLRLASAEACAAALAQAAEAAASGELDADNAVSEAGLIIVPPPVEPEGKDDNDDDDMDIEMDRGLGKWPKKPVLLDTDVFDTEDSWHDAPPEGFSLTMSPFGTMWMALFGWVTCSSVAFVYGRDESSCVEFLSVNGREYPYKIVLGDGRSAEIKQTLAGCIARVLPGLVSDLRLPTSVTAMEQSIGRLLETMSFVDALPPFKTSQWRVIILLFLDALSVHRLPALTQHLSSRRMLQQRVLSTAEIGADEYEVMKDLVIPLGRMPRFSAQSGA
ncbi:hypothetical protein QJS04_geneDACA004647 [Acorus gramineus]|uniref:RNA polymerase II subunit B1 CTD phosphatase RPAP2 homolog n=1 Tax=Acorus gramineus TaxID=55184 RepID=A0AAV9BX92_ACOGR|nr:hypothetical protein QJS04_geneDACA004647 [Acorus gramineus]